MLTHKAPPRGGWTLDGLIRAVAGVEAGMALRDRRREVRADTVALRCIGVVIDGDRVRRMELGSGGVEQMPGGVEQMPSVSRYKI